MDTLEETAIAKLRNQLSPHYSLPDMILLMDTNPEIKELLIKQAKQAKINNERIDELLIEIENQSDKQNEWKPKKRNPIEAAKFEAKIRKFAIEYLDKNIHKSADDYTKSFCERDFIAGFYKCYDLQLDIRHESEKEFEENKNTINYFFDNTILETAIKAHITMHDYSNWNNGDYNGNMHEVVPHLLKLIKEHNIEFSEYLHKFYPNVVKPENYMEVPIEKGQRKWMNAFLADDCNVKTTGEVYDEFLIYKQNKI